MKSKKSLEGYLQIDHRFSPGLPGTPEGAMLEAATHTCAHCHAIVVLNPKRTRPRGYCAKCDRYVCDTPACGLECRNMNQLLDRLQEQAFKNLL